MVKEKRRRGDRRDAKRVANADPMHVFMPYLLPGRVDNEAVLNDKIDCEALEKYIEEKNASDPPFRYTMFHAVLAALGKTVILRPKLNYFYQGHRLYERNEISFAFVVKRKFDDKSEEALAIAKLDKDGDGSPIEQIHSKVEAFVTKVRKNSETDGATDKMGVLTKIPRFVLRIVVKIMKWLDYHGWMPQSFMDDDPYYRTFFVTNLGSIKTSASYHHLTNWGTNSIFVIMGEKAKRPVYAEDGSSVIKDVLPMGLTIDERIADGFYFAKSFKLFKYILEHPELLDKPCKEEIDYKD